MSEVTATAWGSGARGCSSGCPTCSASATTPRASSRTTRQVADAWRAFGGWRVPRSGLVVQALVPSVIEQKVTGQEAFSGYRRLVRRFGEPAPGPGEALRLAVPPDPARLGPDPVVGVARRRRRPAAVAHRRAGGPARRPARGVRRPRPPSARARLQALPGVGRWTWAEVAQRALGLPDEVSFGDYHVAKDIGWALTGTPVDDDGLAVLLEPYAGHRYRVQRLLELPGPSGRAAGPGWRRRTHLPVRGR